jgi:hypothetical protein
MMDLTFIPARGFSYPRIFEAGLSPARNFAVASTSVSSMYTEISTYLTAVVDKQFRALEKSSDPRAPSSRSLALARDAALSAGQMGIRVHRAVELPDGGVVLYIFGGEPDSRGTYPRHAGIVADNEEECLSVFLSTYGHPQDAEVFEVDDGQLAGALNRIARFIKG